MILTLTLRALALFARAWEALALLWYLARLFAAHGIGRAIGRCGRAFEAFSARANRTTGSPLAFFLAVSAIVLWALSGPLFHFSDSWQLIANTGTTLVTFLLGFIIANAQNRAATRDHAAMRAIGRLEKEHGQQLTDLYALNSQQLDILRGQNEQIALLHALLNAQQGSSPPPVPAPVAAPPTRPRRKRASAIHE